MIGIEKRTLLLKYFISDLGFFSFLWETCGPNVFRGDFHDSFALDLQVKDIRLFVEMAKQANVSIYSIPCLAITLAVHILQNCIASCHLKGKDALNFVEDRQF